ncbi:AraC family transcriptional regulator [Xanthobacteraceae bacterium A53D]
MDAWKETAYSLVELEVHSGSATQLIGTKRSIRGANGTFATSEGSEHRTVFSPAASLSGAADAIVVSVMIEGSVGLESLDGSATLTPPARLVAYDATRPTRYHWGQGKEIYVVVPRAKALEAFGGELPLLALPLDTNPLGIMVRDQMLALDRHAEHLNPREIAATLDALHQLVFLLLQRLGRETHFKGEADPNSLFIAAKRYMRFNYATANLTPDLIAHALGCSRATLYRAFTQNNATIMDTLRDIRLTISRKLIETGSERSMAVIAHRCGFSDPTSFGRQFRNRFGVSPGKWRGTFT